MDKLIYRSAHHGCINHENQLAPTLELFAKYPEVGLVEIDFIHYNGKFISSHDYEEESIALGSTLEQWIEHIISLDKMLWVDIKDTTLSIISSQFSEFDVACFYKHLIELEIKFPTIKKHILLSCQYMNTYENLVKLNPGYTIIYDMPKDYSYVLDRGLPLSFIKDIVHYATLCHLEGVDDIVCIDKSFFVDADELSKFIQQLTSKVIIVYSYELNETNLPIVNGKHIIYQYNYTFH